jgi:hypothetical protein
MSAFADRRRIASLRKEVVGDALSVAMLDVGEARSTDPRNDVVAQRGLVASSRARFVEVAGPGAHATQLHAGNELLGGLLDSRVRRRAQRASPDPGLRL